jgi:cbb3-type cytochrome oxidase subunit 3
MERGIKIIVGVILFLVLVAFAYLTITKPSVDDFENNFNLKQDEKNEVIEKSSNQIINDLQIEEYMADVVYKTDSLPVPSWIFEGGDASPWTESIYLAKSNDGKTFTDEKFFVQHAGVSNLLLTNDNKLVATFQYFSYEQEELFDRIVYTVSEDFGETWSSVKRMKIDPEFYVGPSPVDPTLVQLEDGRYRLYFTYHKHGKPYPELFSAISSTLNGIFENEGVQLSIDGLLLDPAVVFFKNEWHHYTTNHEGIGDMHSVSSNGLNFELKENLISDFQFLGGAIEDDGKMKFYGTKNGVVLAESSDGYSFTKIKENVVDGADPGIAKLPSGSYIISYTKLSK